MGVQVIGSGGQTVNAVGVPAMRVNAAAVRVVGAGGSGSGARPLTLAVERSLVGADTLAYTDGVIGGTGDLTLPPYADSSETQAFRISAFMGPITITPDGLDELYDVTNTLVASVTVAESTVVELLHYAGVWRVTFDSSVTGDGFDGEHNDLDGRDAADAHPGSAVSFDPDLTPLTATNAQAAIAEAAGLAQNHIDNDAGAHEASAISVDAASFDGNLTTDDDTVQKVAQKFDDLTIGSAGYGLASPERISAKAQPGNPVVTYDTSAYDADEIREPGQAIYDPVTGLWILPYTGEFTDTVPRTVGLAVLSDDGGETWTPHPQNPILPEQPWETFAPVYEPADVSFDDPYVAKTVAGEVWRDSDGRAHIYVEEKANLTHVGIGRWVSAPGTLDDWTYTGRVLEPAGGVFPTPAPSDVWDYTDRTSPVVVHDGTRLNLLYEGRNLPTSARYPEWAAVTAYDVGDVVWTDGPLTFYRCVSAHTSTSTQPGDAPSLWDVYVGQLGATGLAVSTDDGDSWTVHGSNPIIDVGDAGSWNAVSVVIDDIIRVGGEWIALVHGLDAEDGTYVVGRYRTSDDPVDWNIGSFTECVGNPYDTATNTMMCWGNDPTQGVCIRQLAANPGIGELLERVWITPTVGVEDVEPFDPTGLQDQIDTLDGRVDAQDVVIGGIDDRVGVLEAAGPPEVGPTDRLANAAGHVASTLNPGAVESDATWVDIYTLVGGPTYDELDAASQLDHGIGPVVIVPSASPTGEARGVALFAPTAPTPNAELRGVRLVGVELSAAVPVGAGVQVLLSDGVGPTPQWGFVQGGSDSNRWVTDPELTAGVAIGEGAAPAAVDIYLAAYGTVAAVTVGIPGSAGPLPSVTIQSTVWHWRIPVDDLGGTPADPEWNELARFTTASANDWPTFNSVPTYDRYRLRWYYSPTNTPAGIGGLTRNMLLTFDGDTTSGNYASGTTGASSTGASLIVTGAFGQGGGGFGEVEFIRITKRFSSVPVLRRGVHSLGRGVSGTGSVVSVTTPHHGTYVKPDGTTPDLSTWAIAASNNDSWAAGITFILEGANLP